MRLTVLRGSAASPNTGAGCPGFLVQRGETSIVLDLGPGTLLELRRHTEFRTLSAVIVSHIHVDHMLDLIALRHSAKIGDHCRLVRRTVGRKGTNLGKREGEEDPGTARGARLLR